MALAPQCCTGMGLQDALVVADNPRLDDLSPLAPSGDPLHPDPSNPSAPSEREPAVLGPGGAALRAADSASPRSPPAPAGEAAPAVSSAAGEPRRQPLSAAPWLRPTPGQHPAPAPSLQPAPPGLGA